MLIYDTEIINAVPQEWLKPENNPDISFCKGWDDFEGMGIGVLCAYDTACDRHRVFMGDNIAEFAQLAAGATVCGFNNHRFDDPLCRANGIEIRSHRSYDLLSEIWRAMGLDPDYNPATHRGLSLSALVKANFVQPMPKPLPGARTPIEFQRGNIGKVVDYCLNDVHMLTMLVCRLNQNGFLVCPKTGDLLRLRKPTEVVGF